MIAWAAYALAVAALAGVAAWVAEGVLRLYRREARWVWAAAIVASLAAPLFPARRDPVPVAGAGAGPALSAAPVAGEAEPRWSAAAEAERVLPALWAASSAAILAGMAGGALVMARRRRRWERAALAGTEVLVSAGVGPAVVGWLRPAVVVPRWVLGWAAPMKEMVVRHEREHIRAGDPLLLLAAGVAAALVPWNPALWWQLRRLRLAVEVDCDARTLRVAPDVVAYGLLLLRVGALASGRLVPALSEPRSSLERRIRIMTSRTPRDRARRAGAGAVLAVAVACAAYALPAPAFPAPWARDTVPALPDTVRELSRVDVAPRFAGGGALELRRLTIPGGEGVTGTATATASLVVGADGVPAQIAVTGDPRPLAIERIRGVVGLMRFIPATLDGRAVAVRVSIPLSVTFLDVTSATTTVTTTITVDTVYMAEPTDSKGRAGMPPVFLPWTRGADTVVVSPDGTITEVRVDTVRVP